MKRTIVFILGLGLGVFAVAGRSWMRERAMMDSLRAVNPRFRATWSRDRGLAATGCATTDSEGLRVVGRWSFGPSYDVDCRITPAETLIALGRGSGVSLLRFSRSDSVEFQKLVDINAARVTSRVRLIDTLLFIGTGAGVEAYRVSDGSAPTLLNALLTPNNDFAVRESLLYVMGYDDSFKVYSIADPANPRRLGACRDSGGPVTLTGNTAFVGDQSGLHAIDVSNPANPHRVGSWGASIISAEARGNICCVTEYDPDSVHFYLLDVSNPANMQQLSVLWGAGGDALCIDGQYAYTAGGYGFQILDISDSLDPSIVGRYGLGSYKYGVWGKAGFDRAFVANEANGLAVMNTGDPSHPAPDTYLLAAGYSIDLDVRGPLVYVANEEGGLKVLDASNPTLPTMIGELDTLNANEWSTSVVADDSFAFLGWFNTPLFRSADISDPTHPAFAGSCNPLEEAQDMVLRDSLVYCAENYRFQIINVARPRAPAVVGSLSLPDHTYGMCLRDSLAYVTTYPLEIVSVANPSAPFVVASIPRGAWNVDVQDTFAYVAGGNGLFTYSVADPTAPYLIDSLGLNSNTFDVAVADSLAYVGTRTALFLLSVADPGHPVILGQHALPYVGWRVEYFEPYVYVVTEDAGVCVFDTVATGVSEATSLSRLRDCIRAAPNPTRNWVDMTMDSPLSPCLLSLRDVAGREVASVKLSSGPSQERSTRISLEGLAPGLYFLRAVTEGGPRVFKIVKQ